MRALAAVAAAERTAAIGASRGDAAEERLQRLRSDVLRRDVEVLDEQIQSSVFAHRFRASCSPLGPRNAWIARRGGRRTRRRGPHRLAGARVRRRSARRHARASRRRSAAPRRRHCLSRRFRPASFRLRHCRRTPVRRSPSLSAPSSRTPAPSSNRVWRRTRECSPNRPPFSAASVAIPCGRFASGGGDSGHECSL